MNVIDEVASATTKIENYPIVISLLGDQIEPNGMTLLSKKFNSLKVRDAVRLCKEEGEAWLFDYGVVIFWNLSEESRNDLYKEITPHVMGKIERPLIDQYQFSGTDHVFSVSKDLLLIPDNNPLTLLALSHAFAQSAKLDFFEEQAQKLIKDNAYISRELAKTGRVPLNRKKIARLRGVLFSASSDIALHFNLLDTPEFFWDYPELESIYVELTRYLDLKSRLSILDKKLETIHSLLEMLSSEQNHKHSAFLEWIIIILIAVDILIYFF